MAASASASSSSSSSSFSDEAASVDYDDDGGNSFESYIRMVQHLIEICLTFSLDHHHCLQALAHHAGIPPLVTATVWKELEKANPEFFLAYFRHRSAPPTTSTSSSLALALASTCTLDLLNQ